MIYQKVRLKITFFKVIDSWNHKDLFVTLHVYKRNFYIEIYLHLPCFFIKYSLSLHAPFDIGQSLSKINLFLKSIL